MVPQTLKQIIELVLETFWLGNTCQSIKSERNWTDLKHLRENIVDDVDLI